MGPVKRWTKTAATMIPATAAVLLSGCAGSGVSSGQAATVDGTTIAASDLQEVTAQFNAVAQQPTTPTQVLDTLIKAPALEEMVAGSGQEITDNELLAQLAQLPGAPAEPNRLMADYLHGLVYSQMVGDSAPPDLFADLDVQVNPRYGTWDPETVSLADATPEWITTELPGEDGN